MPELPEVETVRRGLAPAMEGQVIHGVTLARGDLRFPFPDRFAERLTGRRITALSRRAKYLLADLDDDAVLIMHLGMSGRFIVEDAGTDAVPGSFARSVTRHAGHDHVAFALGGGVRIVYNDVRRFGFMDLGARAELDRHPRLAGIGLEPLGNALDGAVLAALLAGRRTSVKAALLDQRLVAGLGNIYVCEALFRSGLSPMRTADDVAGRPALADRLAGEIRAVLEEAIEAGGSTLRDFAHADGELGYFQHAFRVYGREGESCLKPGCRGTVQRTVQAGRSTFHCTSCQR